MHCKYVELHKAATCKKSGENKQAKAHEQPAGAGRHQQRENGVGKRFRGETILEERRTRMRRSEEQQQEK